MISKIKTQNKTELWSGISVLAALFFMLFVYAPIELYCYNMGEFWFDLYVLVPIMVSCFLGGLLISAVASLLVFVFLPKLYRSVILPGLSIVFVCTYIQGNFLIGNLPPMDGSIPVWSDYAGGIVQSLILWAIVSLAVVVLYRKLKALKFAKAAGVGCICMLLMFAVTSVSVLLTTEGYKKKMDACSTTKDQYVFSEDKNFVILVLDSVDAGTFSKMMAENPEYKDIFQDFTYYENMMGAYSCTEVAVPHILSGVWYENEMPMKEYEVASYNNSPLLDAMAEAGYKLGMYEYEMPYEDENVFRFSNVLSRNSKVSSYVDLAKLEIKLVGIRYAPFPLKLKCVFNTDRFAALWQRGDEYPVFIAENKTFYERLLEAKISTVEEKCFKFIHIEGGHVPFRYDEDVNIIDGGTYRDNLKATMTITNEFLDKLKLAGVYDDTVIVIMADHGFDEDYGLVEGVEACEGRQNPIFLVKSLNEKHEMMVSQAPVSYDDIQRAFVDLLEGKSSSDIFDYKEDDERERRYIYYDFVYDEYMYEYTSEGHASDKDAMVFTGNEYIREK